MHYKVVKADNVYKKNLLQHYALVLISVKFKQLVILALFFLTEADLGWAELLLGHEYLSRERSGWHL